MVLPRTGAGRGVGPLLRLSHTTAPPGPRAPPPLTCPLTLTIGTTEPEEEPAGDPEAVAAPATAAEPDSAEGSLPAGRAAPPLRARASAASGRITRSSSGSIPGIFSSASQRLAAVA